MNRGKAVWLLMIFLSLFVFLNFDKVPDDMLSVINKRNGPVYINCEISPEMEIELKGQTHYVLRYLNEQIGSFYLGYFGYNYIEKIDPGGGLPCYDIGYSHDLARKEFLKLEPLEQFKIIYNKFTVKDENGIEILNLETLKPDDFVIVPPPDSRMWIGVSTIQLVIK